MKIHRQGILVIILCSIVAMAILGVIFFVLKSLAVIIPATIVVLTVYFLVWWFFRVPDRSFEKNGKLVYAPADGRIVVIEETTENEYFKDNRIQVSIFMSPLNVHVNYYPVGGKVDYVKYHPGRYLVAWHPKSSTENEHATIAIQNDVTKILVRQIAGVLARRIITNSKPNDNVNQGEELGFIRFGSRVDIFLPVTAKITAQLHQSCRAMKTVVAEL